MSFLEKLIILLVITGVLKILVLTAGAENTAISVVSVSLLLYMDNNK